MRRQTHTGYREAHFCDIYKKNQREAHQQHKRRTPTFSWLARLRVEVLPILALLHRALPNRLRRRVARDHRGELWRRLAQDDLRHGQRGLGDGVEVVPALERDDELAAREAGEHVRHVRVPGRRDVALAQVVAVRRVEACRYCKPDPINKAHIWGADNALMTISGANSIAMGMITFWNACM